MTRCPPTQAPYAASERMPGGVNSPVRACGGEGGTPLCIDHGAGAH